MEPGEHANRFEDEATQTHSGMELAPTEHGYDAAAARRGSRDRAVKPGNSEPETPPKDLTILTFFLMAAYTQAAMEALGLERRTRGHERRDGL